MRRKMLCLMVSFVFAFSVIAFSPITHAETPVSQLEPTEGMPQGDFALWLVKAIWSLKNQKQSAPIREWAPAATADNAIKFLSEQLGLVPADGWQKDQPMTREALASLLPNPDDAGIANLAFKDLASTVRDYTLTIFEQQSGFGGTTTIQSSGTPSAVA